MSTCINCNTPLNPVRDAESNVCAPCWRAYRQWRRERAATGLEDKAREVVKAWRRLGRCEDEFLPEYPDACGEYHEWLDEAISNLESALGTKGVDGE